MKHFLKILILAVCFFNFTLSVNAKDWKFIQVTDLNYQNNPTSIENFNNLIKSINETKDLDFVVFTGDNIKKSDKSDMKDFFKKAKKINVPYYVQFGDTDCSRNALRKSDAQKLLSRNSFYRIRNLNYAVAKGNLELIFVDGTKEMVTMGGYFNKDTLNWLDKKLKSNKNKNVIIFQHFPLVELNETSMKNLYERDKYISLIEKYGNVKYVFTGHFNENRESSISNITHFVTSAASEGNSCYRVVVLKSLNNKEYDIFSQIVRF